MSMPELHRFLILPAVVLVAAGCLAGCSDASLIPLGPTVEGTYDPEDPFEPGTTDDDDVPPPGPASPPSPVALSPEPGSFDHHYRDPISVEFDGEALGASLSLSQEGGYDIPLESDWGPEGRRLTATPASWLQPNTEYVVRISLGDSVQEYDFTTSTVGLPIASPAEMDNLTFGLDTSAVYSERSPEIASVLASLGPSAAWLWSLDLDVDPDSGQLASNAVDISTGMATGADDLPGEQDLCIETEHLGQDEGTASFIDGGSSSYFVSSPGDFRVPFGGHALFFEDAWVDGDLVEPRDVDGDGAFETTDWSVEALGFRGFLRVDSLQVFFPEAIDVCARLDEIQGEDACAPCPSGYGDAQCAWVDLDGLAAVHLPDIDLLPLDAAGVDEECVDIAADLEFQGCSAAGRSSDVGLLALLMAAAVFLRRRDS